MCFKSTAIRNTLCKNIRMTWNNNLKYEKSDIEDLFKPQNLTSRMLKMLEEHYICHTLIRASRVRRSNKVTESLNSLKVAILVHSNYLEKARLQWIDSESDETTLVTSFNKIKTLHFNLQNDLRLFEIEEEKRVRKENIFFIFKASITIFTVYIGILAISSKSLKPSIWLAKFYSHLHTAGLILTKITGHALAIGAFVLGCFIYDFLEKRFLKNNPSKFSKTLCGTISFIVAFTILIVINNGIRTTFGVDPIHSATNTEYE